MVLDCSSTVEWGTTAATCHGVFGLFMRQTKHNGRYGSFFQNFHKGK